ncbi:hypothetical protein R3I93_016897 [Phoxinus phoxinus]|uniref:Ribonuclease A-domain domain-containing protein n=1 Tax=Phoxinus phoxinus TaxID=58324 RepID=A0AAN9CIY4_9TELE
MEIHQSAVILLLVLCVSFSAHAQPQPGYNNFLKQHVFGAMTVQKCDGEIHAREIVRPLTTNGCKEKNTFILANKKDVKAVCDKAGTPQGDKRISNKPFPVVICKLQKKKKEDRPTHPHCEYRGTRSTRKIVVRCEDGWPVHYAEDVVV